MKLYAAKVQALSDELCRQAAVLLDKNRREALTGIKDKKKRLECICAGLLLRHAFLDKIHDDRAWERAEIRTGIYGKPYIANCDAFFYSLSHSGEWVICAADDRALGADIQKIGAPKMAVARRFYSEKEYDRLMGFEPDKDKQTRELYRIWAAKESCVKLIGRGIGAGIDRYEVDGGFTHITDIYTGRRFAIRMYEDIAGYAVCVCSDGGQLPGELAVADLSEALTEKGLIK